MWNQRKPDPRLEVPALSLAEQRKYRNRRRALVVAAFMVAIAVLVVGYFILLHVPEIGPGENNGTATDGSSP